MKKIFFLLGIVAMAVIFAAAAMPSKIATRNPEGCGYRIIEFGVGINCNGDTIKLVRSNGFQRVAAREEVLPKGDK